jgi:hypothetical protein
MLSNTQPITEREMLLSWGLDEIDTRLRECVTPAVRARVLDRSTLSDGDVNQIVIALKYVREPLVGFFLSHETRWLTADFPASELGVVRVLHCFAEASPNRTLAELAQRKPEMGRFSFEPSITRGRPIFVGPAEGGPWCLMEGNHRCCSVFRGNAAGAEVINSIRVIVGVCALAPEWHWWR